MIAKPLAMVYALISYLVGTAGFFAFIFFLGDWIPSVSINSGEIRSYSAALFINTSLMLLWTLQHIGMARPAFKNHLAKILPRALERSTYMLFTGVMAGLIVLFWSPMVATVYQFENPELVSLINGLYWFGWLYAIAGILYDSYFEFHGLKQAYCYVSGLRFSSAGFSTGFLFRLSRRPTFFGILVAIWATPTMTVGHLFFAATMTLFTLLGCYFVEKSYLAVYGDDYRQYQKKTPLLLPNPLLILKK